MTNSGSTSCSASRSLTTPTSRCRSSWVVSQVRVRIEPNFYRTRAATTTRRLPTTTGYPPTRCFVDLGSTTLYYSTLLLLLINSNPPKTVVFVSSYVFALTRLAIRDRLVFSLTLSIGEHLKDLLFLSRFILMFCLEPL